MELRGKYNTKLQNAVYMSTRNAAKEMGCSTKENVGRWYRELQYYGFIVMECGAHLGVNGMGKAAHPLRVEDVSFGTIGVSGTELTGTVYNLRAVTDIAGRYISRGAELTIGAGVGMGRFANANGVVLELGALQLGLALGVGSTGMTITLQ
jgi:hypothetical protein